MKRIVFDIILVLSVYLFVWPVTLLLALAGIFLFSHFYEFLLALVIMYALHAVPDTIFIASPFWFAVIVVMVYTLGQLARRYMIIYKHEISH